MNDKRYWFPVRPAGRGWGWGLPCAWQGWAVLLAFLVLLTGGMARLAPFGEAVTATYAVVLSGLLLAVVAWKGEPQSMRYGRMH